MQQMMVPLTLQELKIVQELEGFPPGRNSGNWVATNGASGDLHQVVTSASVTPVTFT